MHPLSFVGTLQHYVDIHQDELFVFVYIEKRTYTIINLSHLVFAAFIFVSFFTTLACPIDIQLQTKG